MATDTWQANIADWTSDADWSLNRRPGQSDDVVIAQGSPQVTSDVGTVNSVTASGTGSASIDGGGTLTTANDFSVTERSNSFVDGDTADAVLRVGGALNITNGTLSVNGRPATPATVTVTGMTNNTNSADLSVGDYGVLDASGGYTQGPGNNTTTEVSGTINTSNFSLADGSYFNENISGNTTGAFGQVFASGGVALGSANLRLFVDDNSTFAPTIGEQFDIIHNNGTSAVSGNFADLAEGAIFKANNADINFSITYHGGTSGQDVVLTDVGPVCFASGTRIRTAQGDVLVENLMVGDLAITACGALRAIRWIGHRKVYLDASAGPHNAWPVRICAGAFGGCLPERDLLLSPGHLVLVGSEADEHFVPIMCLVNGTTIERVAVDEVIYWHVELDEHDILLAEGLPAESYIDLGSRRWFAGADGALYDPDMVLPGMPGRCRPVATDGPVVEAERRRLDAVFAMQLAGACAWPNETSLPGMFCEAGI